MLRCSKRVCSPRLTVPTVQHCAWHPNIPCCTTFLAHPLHPLVCGEVEPLRVGGIPGQVGAIPATPRAAGLLYDVLQPEEGGGGTRGEEGRGGVGGGRQ
jgi:hypothetical protein